MLIKTDRSAAAVSRNKKNLGLGVPPHPRLNKDSPLRGFAIRSILTAPRLLPSGFNPLSYIR